MSGPERGHPDAPLNAQTLAAALTRVQPPDLPVYASTPHGSYLFDVRHVKFGFGPDGEAALLLRLNEVARAETVRAEDGPPLRADEAYVLGSLTGAMLLVQGGLVPEPIADRNGKVRALRVHSQGMDYEVTVRRAT